MQHALLFTADVCQSRIRSTIWWPTIQATVVAVLLCFPASAFSSVNSLAVRECCGAQALDIYIYISTWHQLGFILGGAIVIKEGVEPRTEWKNQLATSQKNLEVPPS